MIMLSEPITKEYSKINFTDDLIINEIIDLICNEYIHVNKLIENILFYFIILELKNCENKYNFYIETIDQTPKKKTIAEFEKIMNLYEKLKNIDKENIIKHLVYIIKTSQNKKLTNYQKQIDSVFKKINLHHGFYDINNNNMNNNINNNILFLNSPLFFLENNLLNIYKDNHIDIIDLNQNNISLLNMYNNFIGNNNLNIQHNDFIRKNCVNKLYDLIISYFPEGIKNIIHAECCDRIKNLKIRGTKSEPLILQLVMSSLQENGEAFIIVPNTLLFNDSKQHIETRKYLLEKFNVIHVVPLNDCNNSLIYFKNNGITKFVNFKMLKDNQLSIFKTIDINDIKLKDYNLFYEKYNDLEKKLELSVPLSDLVDVITNENINEIDLNLNHYLVFSKYLNNKDDIKLLLDELILEKDTFILLVKDKNKCSQKYLNYYLFNNLINDKHLITTGKLNKIDIKLLLDYKINLLSLKTQKTVASYYDINKQIIEDNENQLLLYKQMINKLININTLINIDKIQLEQICKVKSSPNDETFIVVNKNSSLSGNVNLYTNIHQENTNLSTNIHKENVNLSTNIHKENVNLSTNIHQENTNYYYIGDIKGFDKKCLYFLLKNEENTLYKLASQTKNINLSRKNLESFEIKNLSEKLQKNIVCECNKYSDMIDGLKQTNDYLKNINIFDVILSVE